MADREGIPEDFARMAAALRGQDPPTKAEANRRLVESIHAPEPEPAETETPEQAHNELMSKLLAPKPGQVELIRRLHRTEES